MPFTSAISSVPQRWVICMLCCLALVESSFRRTCFFESYNVVNTFTLRKPTPYGGCPYFYSGCQLEKKKLPFYLPDVYWKNLLPDIALYVFWIGKCLTAVPAGLLSDIGYSRYVLGGGMFLVTISTILLPTTAELGTTAYLMSCILEGIGEGTILPSIMCLISHWTPPLKRNTFTVLVVAGLYYGNTLGHIFFNLNYSNSNLWSFGKYMNGIFGFVWLILWYIFGYHSPAFSPFVSEDDHFTITPQQRPLLVVGLKRLRKVQWKEIISSRPFLSAVLLFCCLQWIVNANIDNILESYEQDILHLPDRFSEASSIVAIAALPTSLMGGFLSDWVIKRELMSRTGIKKIFVFISILLSSVFIMSATFVGCNYILFWIMAITAVYIAGLADAAVFTSPIDLSPRNAGLLMGIMMSTWTLLSLTDLSIGGTVTIDSKDPVHWQLTSTLNVVVAFVLMAPFLVFGSAEKQPWDRRPRLFVSNAPAEVETRE